MCRCPPKAGSGLHSSASTQLQEHLEWHTQTGGCVTPVEDRVWKFCHMVDGDEEWLKGDVGTYGFLLLSSKEQQIP